MKKQNKEIAISFRVSPATYIKLKEKAIKAKTSQTKLFEDFINKDIEFSKNELKEMRFAVRYFLLEAKKTKEDYPQISGMVEGKIEEYKTIIKKLERLQEG